MRSRLAPSLLKPAFGALLVSVALLLAPTWALSQTPAPLTSPPSEAIPPSHSSQPPAPPPSAWSLVWSDNFDGPRGARPNPQFWGFDSGLPPDGGQALNCGWQRTTQGCDPKHPTVFLDGHGHLVLQAQRSAAAPHGMVTGRIRTTSGPENGSVLFATQYGRVEARIWLPEGTPQQGLWPAFWMLGSNVAQVGWPASGEIDIMEYIGARNPSQIYGTLHGPGYRGAGIGVRATRSRGWGGWHTYGILWSPSEIRFYIDNPAHPYGTVSREQVLASKPQDGTTPPTWPFEHPFFLILDLNLGGPFPGDVTPSTTLPQHMLIDWIRVFQAPTSQTDSSQ